MGGERWPDLAAQAARSNGSEEHACGGCALEPWRRFERRSMGSQLQGYNAWIRRRPSWIRRWWQQRVDGVGRRRGGASGGRCAGKVWVSAGCGWQPGRPFGLDSPPPLSGGRAGAEVAVKCVLTRGCLVVVWCVVWFLCVCVLCCIVLLC
jgi:hypothetical protein